MIDLMASDVGDGLCLALHTRNGKIVQIDCGSQQGRILALSGWIRILEILGGPDIFLLSHFHVDHYNGLQYLSLKPGRVSRLRMEKVHYPGIPEFSRNSEFLNALFAINSMIFGAETGVMESDFLEAISRISEGQFSYGPLFAGDSLTDLEGGDLEILWPPRTIIAS